MSFGIWQRTIVTDAGDVIPNATVEVREPSADFSGALVTLYSDEGVTGLSNPFNADSEGFAQFYAAPQKVDIRATGSGSQRTWLDVPIQGTAAVADVISTNGDTTEGRVIVTGGGGLLGRDMPNVFDATDYTTFGKIDANGNIRIVMARALTRAAYIEISAGGAADLQIFAEHYNPASGTITGRKELWHTGNTIVDSNGFIKEA